MDAWTLVPGWDCGCRRRRNWEYACRSGGKEELYCGGSDLDRLAWHLGNSDAATHPVGTKAPNGLGLYDMTGNVWEWTCSAYGEKFGGTEHRCLSKKDATSLRALRASCWYFNPRVLRGADRDSGGPASRFSGLGFRLARTISP